MAMEGGWNARSLERLMMFAHARGMTASDVAHAIQRLARPSAGPAPVVGTVGAVGSVVGARGESAPGPRPAPRAMGPGFKRAAVVAEEPLDRPRTFELTDEEVRAQTAARLRMAFAGVGCGTVVLFGVALGAILLFRTPAETAAPGPAAAPVPAPVDTTKPSTTKPAPAAKPARDVSTDVTAADAVVRQLAAAAARVRENPAEARAQFAQACERASTNWLRWKPDELATAQDGVVEYLYRAESDIPSLRHAAETLGAPARAAASASALTETNVLSAMWSAGILSRVLRERDLPASVSGPARLAVASLLGSEGDLGDGTFASGVSRSALALAPKLAAAPDPAAWRAWLAGVGAVAADVATRGRMIVSALDATLMANPDPLGDAKVVESFATLTTALTWRLDEQTRPWLFRWFDSATVTTPALHALTTALAAKSGAEGVDPTMVLSAAAGPGERSALRGRYAAAWNESPGGARSELLTRWQQAADLALAERTEAESASVPSDLKPHVAALVRAVTMSRLSEAAAWIAVGDSGRATAIVGDVSGPIQARVVSTAVTTDPLGGTNDGAWAIRYLSLMANGPARIEMLKQAQSASALTALECEVVATEAVRGQPAAVRLAARQAVSKHRELPAMLNAVLNLAPILPSAPDTLVFMEDVTQTKLPGFRDARWREAVRRAIVQRLLELAAGKGEYGVVDALAALMGASYRERLAALGGADGLPAEVDGATLLRMIETYRGRWDKEAERLPGTGKEHASLGQIRQRAAGRAGVASNVVQRFVAEQATALELMAHALVSEDASRAEHVKTIMDAWAVARRDAKHIFDQIAASERSMLQLWSLRLRGGTAA